MIARANERDAILLTEDSDFGTWVFAHRIESVGIVFLRYQHGDHMRVAKVLIDVLQRRVGSLRGQFVTLTPEKIRFRAV